MLQSRNAVAIAYWMHPPSDCAQGTPSRNAHTQAHTRNAHAHTHSRAHTHAHAHTPAQVPSYV